VNIEKFRQTELRYNELKEKHNVGEISAEEMKKQLKSLMILDDTGRYWMIGGKTGKWYTYNGKEWTESNPYPVEAEKPVVVEEHIDTSDNPFPSRSEYSFYGEKDDNSYENKEEETEESAHISLDETEQATTISFASSEPLVTQSEPEPKKTSYTEHYAYKQAEAAPLTKSFTSLTSPSAPINHSEQPSDATLNVTVQSSSPIRQIEAPAPKDTAATRVQPILSSDLGRISMPTHITIKQISFLPAMIFMGGFGSIFGVIFGAMFGIFKVLEPLAGIFPMMLVEMRGKVFGGLLFAAVGGLTGFILFALAGVLIALFYNTVASVFCGLRLKIKTE
jgi:hypothetical protein